MKYIRNVTAADIFHTNSGYNFIVGQNVQIPQSSITFINDSIISGLFVSGDLVFFDGTNTYTGWEGFHRLIDGAFGVPFLSDPERANGFVSKNVQEAIEEAKNADTNANILTHEYNQFGNKMYMWDAALGQHVEFGPDVVIDNDGNVIWVENNP